jgi:hypothetical protein
MTTCKVASLLFPLGLLTFLFAQGLDTPASKDDWEEINFEFNSSVLVDGFPSLLRLAELLDQHPGYKVRVEGHTDGLGSDAFNQRLGLARANMVRDFLVKYRARPTQIETISRGKAQPKAPKQGTTYSKTDEARYINRRVVLTVMDEQGRTVGAGGAGDAIRALQPDPNAKAAADCCNEVLKRLDKLDEISKMLRDLADQNAALRQSLADLQKAQQGLQQGQQALESRVNQAGQSAQAAQNAAAAFPSADAIAKAAADEVDKRKDPKYQTLGVNVGSDDLGNVTFTGKGRFFAPMGQRFAFQAQAEYLYFHGAREGQFDVGLVDRLGRRVQAGLFASFKHVTLSGNQSGGTLGQGAFTLDYIFKYGRVGIFGTKGFLDDATINRANAFSPDGVFLRNVILERYLHIVDQAGASGTIGLIKNVYLEGNVGYLKSLGYGDRVGGTLRLVFPLNSKIAFTAEGGINETMLSRDNTGRAVFGVQFGNFLRPKEYQGSNRAVPADVPRVRYEVLTRRLKIGNDPPIADAGPNQTNVPPGIITLDGSKSYDPDGDPITYQWSQEGGPAVTISNPTAPMATFNAAAGQLYQFRLVVKDIVGLQAAARVSISTRSADRVQILFFIANPPQIQRGSTSTLSWRVLNADTVTIPGIGTVAAAGTAPVSPQQTTVYTLTAKNSVSEESANTSVDVISSAKLLYCYAQPATIVAGEASTLYWSAPQADSVSIAPGIGPVAKTGSVVVTPTTTTAYTLTATAGTNTTADQCGIVVTVGGTGGPPRIIRFSATPMTINSGQTSTLLWVVENADKVNVSPTVGDTTVNGSQDVSPAQTTQYTLTATNKFGTATAQATVNVNIVTPTKIVSFTADPPVSPSAGSKVNLTCQTSGATSVIINGITFLPPNPVAVVFPLVNTTYTCVANGPNGQSDTKTVTVTIAGGGTTPPPGPTIVIAGGLTQETELRDFIIDASGSFSSTNPGPLTYLWTSHDSLAAILNPTSPTPRVQINNFLGTYLFDVTVTDSKGNSAKATISIKLVFVP